MGSYTYKILDNRENINVVGGIDIQRKFSTIQIARSINEFDDVDLLIDFTNGKAAYQNIKDALNRGIKVLSGTTGMPKKKIMELKRLSKENKVSLMLIPNFAFGASIMYKILDDYKDYFTNIDIIELHHKNKKDKPSGTAKEYADLLDKNYDEVESVRIYDVLASHEIIVNNLGEKLIIRHEINQRDAFLNGFLVSLNYIKRNRFVNVVGLDEFFKIVKKLKKSILL